MIDIQIGDIVFSGKRDKNWFSRGVMWFTGSRWSHCFFIMTDVAGERAVLEADLHCQVVPWHREYEINNNDYYEVYRLTQASDEEKADAANKTYVELSGEIYGFTQIIWFMWDAFCKKIKMDSGRQWFPNGIVCSGAQDTYLQKINTYREAFKQYEVVNRVTPQELYEAVLNRPDLFKFIGKRD